MKINLNGPGIFGGQINRFNDTEINFDKPINFIFGKNGTGKSSLCKLIEKQRDENIYDTYIFQGFDSVLDENRRLGAIVLGEENVKINKEIKNYQEKIKVIKENIDNEEEKIKEPEGDKENLFTQKKALEREKEIAAQKEQEFYTAGARKISGLDNPKLVENARGYNKNSFESEIDTALKQPELSDSDIETLKSTIQSNQKLNIEKISLNEIDFGKLDNEIRELLKKTVQPTVKISELDGDSNKQQFAKFGKDCHKAGDVCAFCGETVTSERLQKLERYFSGSEIESFSNEIRNKTNEVKQHKETLGKIQIDESEFYPEFKQEVSDCKKNIENIILKQTKFLESCINNLEDKQKNLFSPIVYETKELPPELKEYLRKYNDIVDENNDYTEELEEKKKEARDKLRYNKIADIVRKSNLRNIKDKIKEFEIQLADKEEEIEVVKNEIENLEKEKEKIQGKIDELITETKNTEKLTKNISEKLKIYANFGLERKEESGREFYEIKETIDGKETTRPVDELSTGEKNIIAFLYFVESLNDAEKDHTKPKIVAFDDPMNSNDDTMQYLLVDELQKVIKSIKRNSKFIMFTHNVLFYLNVTRSIKEEYRRKRREDGSIVNPYEECNFYRLMACDGKTTIHKIQEEKDDFKSQYESLWYELGFLYSMEKPELMCNPIRRIIESYISFTQNTDFYRNNKDAKNLFNANSHDTMLDPTTDLLGKTHDEVKEILRKCFEDNNAKEHFTKYWNIATKNSN